MPSIRSCVDIVRQGRCTLVTSIQMYQILALNCLISAYSLSVLYLDGVKYGDTQMTAMGMLGEPCAAIMMARLISLMGLTVYLFVSPQDRYRTCQSPGPNLLTGCQASSP